jgi:hypothetical protein
MSSDKWLVRRRIDQIPKILFIVAVAMTGAVQADPLCAQDVEGMVGIKAGAITTGVDSEIPAFLNTDWRTGMSAGVFVALDPASNLTVRADLLFSQRGFGFRMYQEGPGLIPGEANVKSLELQMDVGLRIPWPGQKASVRVFAGPALGYQLSCRVNGSLMGMAFKQDCDEPTVGLETRTLDLGASVGAGMDFNLLPFTVVMDGRYTYGLRNLNKGSPGSENLSSRAWSFTVGIGWPF